MPTIDFEIPHSATLNQLSAPTLDGHPDENARENCVPTSIAEGLRMLTGHTYDPDELKDAIYGQGYTGTQAAAAYVHYCHAAGVALTPFNSTNQSDLVARLRHEVYVGHPVVLTMPSEWNTAPANPLHPSGYTHVGLAVGIGGTTGHPDAAIRVMNPWGGFWQDEPDDWWAQRLCYGQIWIMSKSEVAPAPAPAPKPAPVVVATPAPAPVPAAPVPVVAPVAAPEAASAAPPPQPVSVPPTPAAPSVAPVSAPETPKESKPVSNPSSIFARAAAGLPLAAWERATLRFLQGLAPVVIVALLGALAPYFASGAVPTLSGATLHGMAGAAFSAVFMAIFKWFSAKGDATPPAA